MTQYMDYGNIGGSTAAPTPVINKDRGQVFLATHDGQDKLLSLMRRSFISFSWGGKNIEDFNLIVSSDGDFYQKQLYSSFNSLTTNNDIMDGQYFWGSFMEANEIELVLATDGILENQLQTFKNWFKPGIVRELILSEAPNRKGYARITEAPQYSLIPFEEKVVVSIGGRELNTSTTVWRGTIDLSFTLDDPYWESIKQIYINEFSNNLTSEEQDILKVIEEDGIPHISMFKNTINNDFQWANKMCFIGDNQYIYTKETTQVNQDTQESTIIKDIVVTSDRDPLHPEIETHPQIDLNSNTIYYLYNCGTAPAKPIIHFAFEPVWDDNSKYITFPPNSYALTSDSKKYATISIGSHDFNFTTPGILSSYNQAIKIITEDFNVGDSIVELKKAFRDSISDVYVRMTAMAICELAIDERWNETVDMCDLNGALTSNFKSNFAEALQGMYAGNKNANNKKIFICSFNSDTGESLVTTHIQTFDGSLIAQGPPTLNTSDSSAADYIEAPTLKDYLPWKVSKDNTNPIMTQQNAGDMVCSKYLIIDERTLIENGYIMPDNCLQLKVSTGNNSLLDFSINYNYIYY